jgi:hypothetical protein
MRIFLILAIECQHQPLGFYIGLPYYLAAAGSLLIFVD